MITWAARLLVRAGIALLLICLVLRPAIHTPSGMMGDNLAIISCLLLIGVALIGVRVGKKIDPENSAILRAAADRKSRAKAGANAGNAATTEAGTAARAAARTERVAASPDRS